ncbi:hypothetical protein P9112_013132 [Eukaryota sp. TZLM1-RC]
MRSVDGPHLTSLSRENSVTDSAKVVSLNLSV